MDMKQAIQRVADRQDLTGEEAGEVMELLLTRCSYTGSDRSFSDRIADERRDD